MSGTIADMKPGHRLKLERAEKHFSEFRSAYNDFFNSNPYSFFFEDDTAKGERVYRMKIRQEIPDGFATIIGDVVQNFRSVLDYIIHEAIAKTTGIWPSDRTISFPIGKDPSQYAYPTFGGKVEGLGEAGKQILASLKAYDGGNTALWRLHSANNLDKHQLLVTACAALTKRGVPARVRRELIESVIRSEPAISPFADFCVVSVRPKSAPFPLKDGSELWRIPIDELDDNLHFTFSIAFIDPPPFSAVSSSMNS